MREWSTSERPSHHTFMRMTGDESIRFRSGRPAQVSMLYSLDKQEVSRISLDKNGLQGSISIIRIMILLASNEYHA
jgi:hypothetical protein